MWYVLFTLKMETDPALLTCECVCLIDPPGMSADAIAFMHENIDVIIHCAAVVDFNERIDRAIELNVMGAVRLMQIAQRCKKISAFIHVRLGCG